MKIVCDNKIPFLRGVLEPYAEVVYLPGAGTTPEVVRDADALITRTRTACAAPLLEGSSVKVIATATIGFDHIDTEWCEAGGIVWRNAPGCNSGSVAQYMASVLCVLAQRHSLDLSQTTLGVVGVGNVGRKVARVGEALGMRVLLCDPPRRRAEGGDFVSLDEIVRSSDIVTLHVPLRREGEDATYHLFDETRLRALQGKILVNSSRGPVVDNAALKSVLSDGLLKAAVLDVWEEEPELDPELVGMLDIATPHIAGYSADGKANGTAAAVRTVSEVLGLPLTSWSPAAVPAPVGGSLDFTIDCGGKSCQQVLTEAVLYTYDVREDDAALRSDLALFETLRGDYPVRREPHAFRLTLAGGTEELARRARALGFETSLI